MKRMKFTEWLDLAEERECPFCYWGYKIPFGVFLREVEGYQPKPSDFPCDKCKGTGRYSGPNVPEAHIVKRYKRDMIMDENKIRAEAEHKFEKIKQETPPPPSLI